MNNRPEKLFENFFLKSFGGSKNCLTFASAFRKKAVKEEFFERFRYKQASSTKAYLSKQTETVYNLYNIQVTKIDRFGSWADYRTRKS